MVGSIAWNDTTNMLAAMADGKLAVWYYPLVSFTNKDLLPHTVVRHEDGLVSHCTILYVVETPNADTLVGPIVLSFIERLCVS